MLILSSLAVLLVVLPTLVFSSDLVLLDQKGLPTFQTLKPDFFDILRLPSLLMQDAKDTGPSMSEKSLPDGLFELSQPILKAMLGLDQKLEHTITSSSEIQTKTYKLNLRQMYKRIADDFELIKLAGSSSHIMATVLASHSYANKEWKKSSPSIFPSIRSSSYSTEPLFTASDDILYTIDIRIINDIKQAPWSKYHLKYVESYFVDNIPTPSILSHPLLYSATDAPTNHRSRGRQVLMLMMGMLYGMSACLGNEGRTMRLYSLGVMLTLNKAYEVSKSYHQSRGYSSSSSFSPSYSENAYMTPNNVGLTAFLNQADFYMALLVKERALRSCSKRSSWLSFSGATSNLVNGATSLTTKGLFRQSSSLTSSSNHQLFKEFEGVFCYDVNLFASSDRKKAEKDFMEQTTDMILRSEMWNEIAMSAPTPDYFEYIKRITYAAKLNCRILVNLDCHDQNTESKNLSSTSTDVDSGRTSSRTSNIVPAATTPRGSQTFQVLERTELTLTNKDLGQDRFNTIIIAGVIMMITSFVLRWVR